VLEEVLRAVNLVPHFLFVERIAPDLKLMQILDREFAMSGVTGDTVTEPVCVLVARGSMASILRDIGLKIHAEIIKQKKDPSQN
jgi:hypothetical protein